MFDFRGILIFVVSIILLMPGVARFLVNNFGSVGKFDAFDRDNAVRTLRLIALVTAVMFGIVILQHYVYYFR